MPTISGITPSASSICTGTQLTLTAGAVSGAGALSTYNWSGPNSFSSTGTVTTATLTPTTTAAGGNYSVSVTYPGAGCISAVTTTSVTVRPQPFAAVITGDTTTCGGASITLSDTASGGVWSSSNSAIATVTGGLVLPVSTGTATILTLLLIVAA